MRVLLALAIALAVVLAPQTIAPCDTDATCHAVWDDTNPLPYTVEGER